MRVFVETLDKFVKGTVFCVCPDNLGAHGLAGFQEAFNVEKFCTFFFLGRDQRRNTEEKDFKLRTIEQHNAVLEELKASNEQSVNGVKRECVLTKHLSYLHPGTGFPPDILHDFF